MNSNERKEFMLCGVEVKREPRVMSEDPEIWIEKPNEDGMIDAPEATVKELAGRGNKEEKQPKWNDNVSGMIDDDKGSENTQAKVTTVPDCGYNGFSLQVMKMIQNGWRLNGDENGIVIKKDGKQVKIDSAIEPENGMIFATNAERQVVEQAAVGDEQEI